MVSFALQKGCYKYRTSAAEHVWPVSWERLYLSEECWYVRNHSINLRDRSYLKEHLGDSSAAFALQNSFHYLLDFPDFKEVFHVFGTCCEENSYCKEQDTRKTPKPNP